MPFDAVKTFVDPSVEIGFKFEEAPEAAGRGEDTPLSAPTPLTTTGPGAGEVVSLDKFRKH